MERTRGPVPVPAASGALEVEGFTDVQAVAAGGDSTIYRAYQSSLDRYVAIKVVNLSEPDELRRFHREIALTVRLGRAHPNIVTVLDTRTLADGRPAIVMDFFELGSAHDRLRSTGPMAPDDVVSIGRVIGDALAFAHGQRVVHRDVKPQNILILPTSYVLADFGIARSVDSGHTASLERLSYRHSSPEVLDGRVPEPTDDLWSLCSTMATLLEGRAPFASDDPDDDTALAYLRRVRTAQRRPLPDDVPAPLARVIAKGMGPDRSHRFQRAEDLIAQLRDLERATTAWAPGSEAPQPIPSPTPLTPPILLDSAADRDSEPTSPRAVLSTSPRTRLPATAPPTVAPPVPDPARMPHRPNDLPVDSDDQLWAPGASTAAPNDGPGGPDDAGPAAVPVDPSPVDPAADGAAPPGHPAVPDRSAADAGTARDGRDGRISAGHTRPSSGDPVAPAVSVAARSHAADRSADAPDHSRTGTAAAESSDPVPQPDAAPTGWRPDTAVSHPADPAADAVRTAPKVRAGIIVIAAVMLIASGVLAYFLARPTSPTGTGTGTTAQVGAGASFAAGSPISAPPLSLNDEEYVPQILSVGFDGDNVMVVKVRGPAAEDAQLVLLDATGYDPETDKGRLVPLSNGPQPQATGGETQISVPFTTRPCSTIVVAVLGTNFNDASGMALSNKTRTPGCPATSSGSGRRTAESSGGG